jgi:hypothetical protein
MRHRSIYEGNMKLDSKELVCESVNRIQLALDIMQS